MKTNWKKLIASIGLPLFVGYFGSMFTINQIPTWYAGINKPSLLPPNGVFGPVWTILYILMGIALYLVWNSKNKKNKNAVLTVFGIQLILNFFWSLIFFNYHLLFLAVIEILALWVMILINIIKFKSFSKTASVLLYPYLAWVSFATYLTVSVWLLN